MLHSNWVAILGCKTEFVFVQPLAIGATTYMCKICFLHVGYLLVRLLCIFVKRKCFISAVYKILSAIIEGNKGDR